jgi:hypothetical protein
MKTDEAGSLHLLPLAVLVLPDSYSDVQDVASPIGMQPSF